MNLPKFTKQMRKHFGMTHNVQKFVDYIMLEATGKITIDALLLDDWLCEKHGDYTKERGLSMADLIKKEYGLEAHDFVASNL